MGDPEYPAWLDVFLQKQSDTISAVLDKHLSGIGQPAQTPQSPPKKKAKSEAGSSKPPESPTSHPRVDEDEDEDDEFERRFEHLIGDGNDMEDPHCC